MSKRILVVDDEGVFHEVLRAHLEREGYIVDTVFSGEKAIEETQKNTYDLVFLDLNLPGIDGIETLRKLRRIDKSIRVCIVTGFQDVFLENLRMLSREGVDFEILTKPVIKSQIIAAVRGALEGAYFVDESQ